MFVSKKIMPHPFGLKLTVNNVFPNAEAFYHWFNTDSEGKIIAWTDLKY